MNFKFLFLGTLVFLTWTVFGLSDEQLIKIRDGFELRRDAMLKSQVAEPYPLGNDSSNTQLYAWSKLNYALSAMFLNTELEMANQAVIDAVDNTLESGVIASEFGLHWYGGHLCRIYEFFKDDSARHPGRLSPNAKEKILTLMWQWAKQQSKLAEADTKTVWCIWGSENHEAMRDATSWAAAKMFIENPPYNTYRYNDGSTPQQQYHAWTAFHTEYLKERIRKGLLVEIASSNYSAYTLQGWYNFYDFSDNAELKKTAGYALDLWWADWAQEQINGVRGGGKNRIPQGRQSLRSDVADCQYNMCWYYLNQGIEFNKHPNLMCLATSQYRLPLVIMDIALDLTGRGIYETYSRRMGFYLAPDQFNFDLPIHTYPIASDCGRIIKYSYCTPEFILGTLMFEKRQESEWANISDQNRWQGLVFSSNAQSRIVPIAEAFGEGDRNYNAHWSVQKKGTLITQKLTTSHQAGAMRVFFSGDLSIEEADGWIFVETELSDAFAAVKILNGRYRWADEKNGWGKWIYCDEEYTPVIIEAVRAADYKGFNDFKASVVTQCRPIVYNDILTYPVLGGSGVFTFDIHGSNPPLIDGKQLDYCPKYTFESPFIKSDFGCDIVEIVKDGRSHIIDINSK